jgi:cytidylate kinase
MAVYRGGGKYVPGTYAKQKPDAAEMAHQLISRLERERLGEKKEESPREMPATICFSRKIGVGALDIADILAKRLGYRVFDREIVEHIANEGKLSEKTVTIFDERYPGRLNEFLSLAFGEKAFIRSDYARQLLSALFSMAYLSPAIFVGRGSHLVLPRERTLAVWFIGSKTYRATRMAAMLNIPKREAEGRLDQIDKQQRHFFNMVFGIKEVSAEQFDLVINCDYFQDPESAADLVQAAFQIKFGEKMTTAQ